MSLVLIVIAFFAGIYAGKRRALKAWRAEADHDRLMARVRGIQA